MIMNHEKTKYEQIPIPDALENVVTDARRRAAARTRRMRLSIATAACLTLFVGANVPTAYAVLSEVPILGSIVRVLQIGGGGTVTDGLIGGAAATQDTVKIFFSSKTESTVDVPNYEVVRKTAPNRILFTFNGVRDFDYAATEASFLALPTVKSVYRTMILDDSAIGFVVELTDNADYLISEYKEPGYLEVSLFTTPDAPEVSKVFFVRTPSMAQGEPLAQIRDAFLAQDATVVQTADGKYAAVMGAFATREEAEQFLKTVQASATIETELYVDGCQSNENPR